MKRMAIENQSEAPDAEPPGHLPLTAEERNLMFLTLTGQTPAEMAATLGRSPAEVQTDLERLQGRFGVSDQRRLIIRALLRGWHTPPH